MDLIERITEDMKQAMRAGDTLARDTLRMLKAELTKPEAADGATVLAKAAKSRAESADEYDRGGRPELAAKERAEIAIIERYLPEKLSEDDALAAVRAIATEIGASEKKDLGRLMKEVLARHKGVIDGKLASTLAAKVLG
ncbi:MAG: GatB/YqeY domain-containing protein [Polyangiaceae bacterium]|nr:GatB/YqeY domain-containing protein [Polyangiaceae bacterium]